jgi:hypothetical protein
MEENLIRVIGQETELRERAHESHGTRAPSAWTAFPPPQVLSRYNHGVEITFDPRKSERNLRERGFGFEMVSEFDFGSALYTIDTRKDYGEVRTRALGFIGDIIYALVFTMRGNGLRVISLRKANRKERNRYEKAKPRIS